jgi:hypothetical protein
MSRTMTTSPWSVVTERVRVEDKVSIELPGEGSMDLQRSYSGHLIVRTLSDEMVRRVADLGRQRGVEIDVASTAIEFGYVGRDSNRFVVRLLLQLARLIVDAEGEIRCQIFGDDSDQLSFEFYHIRHGRLYRESTRVVREPEEDVTEEDL